MIFISKFKFKTDKESVEIALAGLQKRCKKIKNDDWGGISDAIHFTAMEFDVDESVLSEAWGLTAPQEFLT